MFREFVAIDPLALILPTSIYLIIQDKINPHVPLINVLNEVLKNANAEEKTAIQARLNSLNALTAAVQEAVGARTAGARG